MINYSLVTMKDGTVFSATKDCVMQRRGDTIIVARKAGGMTEKTVTLHLPWIDVKEAQVAEGSPPDAFISTEGEYATPAAPARRARARD